MIILFSSKRLEGSFQKIISHIHQNLFFQTPSCLDPNGSPGPILARVLTAIITPVNHVLRDFKNKLHTQANSILLISVTVCQKCRLYSCLTAGHNRQLAVSDDRPEMPADINEFITCPII